MKIFKRRINGVFVVFLGLAINILLSNSSAWAQIPSTAADNFFIRTNDAWPNPNFGIGIGDGQGGWTHIPISWNNMLVLNGSGKSWCWSCGVPVDADHRADMVINSFGRVGIGTVNPGKLLSVNGTVHASEAVSFGSTISDSGRWCGIGLNTTYNVLRIGTYWAGGTKIQLGYTNVGDIICDTGWVNALTIAGSNVGIGITEPEALLHVVGNTRIDGNLALEYEDIAEWVRSSEKLEPGQVVVIDLKADNQVIASSDSYQTSIAGVVSKSPGLLQGERGEGKYPIAHAGRVMVKVTAADGPIRRGDLLVTSPIPGTARRSEPALLGGIEFHRPGTILGKALQEWNKGEGEILVLISLE